MMTIEERLENMERELGRVKRRNRWLLGAILLLVGGWVAAGVFKTTVNSAQAQVAGTAKEIRAKSFVLEDEKGKVRAGLFVGKDGPLLALHDENGKLRAAMCVTKDDPHLALLDENGKDRAGLAAGIDGPGLRLYDEKRKSRVELRVLKDVPDLVLFDENGKVIWSAIK